MRKSPLEICCYVGGAGAFGVFVRWMQDQLAFDDLGLPEASSWHFIVIAYSLVVAFVFLRFVDTMRNSNRLYLSEDFHKALANPGKPFIIARWSAGALMIIGSIVLFATTETDKSADFLRILSILGALSGLCYPLFMTAANDEGRRPPLLGIYAIVPIGFFCMWLITTYKMNSINPVMWSYAIEMAAVIASIIAFFRVAGFVFDTPSPWRSLYFAMLDVFFCIMALADKRYNGMQIIFISVAAMMLINIWVMVSNLESLKERPVEVPDDGFERF